MTKPYLLGALHDGTVRKLTYRIGQKAWMYKEGENRQFYVVEFSKSFLRDVSITSTRDKIEYTRGYFDAEGGVSRNSRVRYYLYFAQKNLKDLKQVRDYLTELGIKCVNFIIQARKLAQIIGDFS